jgi:murein DD-endopeptidase MepM/ murein hydrolase activator NlpD
MRRFAAKSLDLVTLATALATVSLTLATAAPEPAPAPAPVAKGTTGVAVESTDLELLSRRALLMPVKGVEPKALLDNFDEGRGKRKHEAIDILAPRGTPVLAVEDGRIAKLFTSAAGGLTIYQFDPGQRFIYYYAHLDRYAEGLREGAEVKKGEAIGFVGTSGNAPKNTPHLHFAIFRAGADTKWWKGAAINPYPFLAKRDLSASVR